MRPSFPSFAQHCLLWMVLPSGFPAEGGVTLHKRCACVSAWRPSSCRREAASAPLHQRRCQSQKAAWLVRPLIVPMLKRLERDCYE